MVVRAFADIDAFGITAHQFKDAIAHQPVVKHHIGALHQAKGAEGQQVGVTGASANKEHFALLTRCTFAGGAFERGQKVAFGALQITGKEMVTRRPVDHGFPEPAAFGGAFDTGQHAVAEFAKEFGHAPVSGGQQAFDTGTQDAGNHRRGAARRYGDNQRRAIHHRGGDKIAILTHIRDIRQNTGLFGGGVEQGVAGIVFGSTIGDHGPLDILGCDGAGVVGQVFVAQQCAEFIRQVFVEQMHFGTRQKGAFNAAGGHGCAAVHDDQLVGDIKEDRKVIHCARLFIYRIGPSPDCFSPIGTGWRRNRRHFRGPDRKW